MVDSPLIDDVLIRLFRFNTRGFLRMAPADGRVPPVPADGGGTLYVHIPFCEVLCPFCSFHRVQHCHAQARRYFAALRREIGLYRDAGYRFTGVYFGGGTPTTEPAELGETIGLVRRSFPVREISVETNPKDLRPEVLAVLRDAGVTRLSVGVQSFDDGLLREMDRHDKYGSAADIAGHLRGAAGLFPTLNADLIFNQPHQTPAMFARDLAIFRSTGANQVSCYPLMTSPTVLRRMAGAMGVPDRRRLRTFYRILLEALRRDFAPSSAWCFTRRGGGGDEYIVTAENYIGVGSGAFSYVDGALYATTFSLPAYEQRVGRGLTGVTARHDLGLQDRLRYALLVKLFGLRLDAAAVEARYGPSFRRRLWGELLTLRLLRATRPVPGGCELTDRGMYWLMLMMAEFFESVNAYRDAMRLRVQAEQAAILPPAPAASVAPTAA